MRPHRVGQGRECLQAGFMEGSFPERADAVTEDTEGFADAILSDNPTPIRYQSPPESEILAEDALIEKLRLPLERANVRIIPVDEVFQRARR